MDVGQFLEQVGQWTDNKDLVRGTLIIGGTALTVLLTGWRVLHAKKDAKRVTAHIDVPAGTRVKFESDATSPIV